MTALGIQQFIITYAPGWNIMHCYAISIYQSATASKIIKMLLVTSGISSGISSYGNWSELLMPSVEVYS